MPRDACARGKHALLTTCVRTLACNTSAVPPPAGSISTSIDTSALVTQCLMERTAERAAACADAPSEGAGPRRPPMYLIIHNIGKKANVGTLARCATAFGVEEVVLVGSRHFSTFGSHGSHEHVRFRYFPTLPECREWLHSQGVELLGVEICEGAESVAAHPFRGPTAFMLGNEGSGMNEKQLEACDGFVYIPQHGEGTASLNVSVAAAIVLHHFALWAAYPERERGGYKFVVAERPPRTHKRNAVPLSEAERAELVAARAAARAEDGDEGQAWDVFDGEEPGGDLKAEGDLGE